MKREAEQITEADRRIKGHRTLDSNEFENVKRIVSQHKVCWEVWPQYLIDKNENKVQIGFEVDLMGIHYHPAHHPTPGCDECGKVYNDLKRIAHWILPTEERKSKYDIGIFDRSIHSAPIRKLRDDVILTVKILHRKGFDRPVDSCEVDCLNEMEERLNELGAKKGQWRESAKDSET